MNLRLVLCVLGVAALAAPASAQTYSTGTDYSVNASTVPGSGLSLLATVPVDSAVKRRKIEVQNQSTGIIQIVKDDGTGANQTSFFLAAAPVVSGQGGSWSSGTFNGRVRIYGVTGAQIAISTD